MAPRRDPEIHRRLARLPRLEVGESQVPVAVGLRARLLGLAFLDRAEVGTGLLIPRCSSVHTFGMRFALDIFFLGRDGEVIAERRSVPAHRFVACRGAAAVLEVPEGTRPSRRPLCLRSLFVPPCEPNSDRSPGGAETQ